MVHLQAVFVGRRGALGAGQFHARRHVRHERRDVRHASFQPEKRVRSGALFPRFSDRLHPLLLHLEPHQRLQPGAFLGVEVEVVADACDVCAVDVSVNAKTSH